MQCGKRLEVQGTKKVMQSQTADKGNKKRQKQRKNKRKIAMNDQGPGNRGSHVAVPLSVKRGRLKNENKTIMEQSCELF